MLQTSLRAHLTPVLEALPLAVNPRTATATGEELTRPALIRIGDVIPKVPAEGESVPFICLQERGGYDSEGSTVVEILLRCAVYSPEPEEAAQELSNLVHTVRHALMSLAVQPLQGRFRLNCDEKGRLLPWESPTEQNHPYAEGYILSVWEYKSIEGVMP